MAELLPDIELNQNDSEVEIFSKYFSEVDQELCKDYIADRIELRKSDKAAKISRMKGDEYFRQNEFNKAICFYSESIAFAVPNKEEYSLALESRSAAHFELINWKECIVDVDRVLKCGNCPEEKIYRLMLRKANCLLALELYSDARIYLKKAKKSFKKVQNTLNPTQIDEDVEKMSKIDERLQKQNGNKNNIRNDLQTNFPYFSENVNILNSAQYFNLSHNMLKGRHVVAKKDIKEGDVLFIEEPYAISIPNTQERFAKYCRNCFKTTSVYISCTLCTETLYCCEECRDVSWEKEHQWECFGVRKRVLSGGYTLLLSVLFRSSRNKFADSTPEGPVFSGAKDKYPSINTLVTHKERISAENFTRIIKNVTFLMIYLIHFTNYFDWLQTQNDLYKKSLQKLYEITGGLLLKYALQIFFNSDSINIVSVEFLSQFDANIVVERNIATGLYITTSMINHSCVPNAMKSFHGHIKIIRALKDIKKGDEINISYVDSTLDQFELVEMQRSSIQETHFFRCMCINCEKKRIYSPWICLICKNKLTVRKESLFFGRIIHCVRCNVIISIEEYKERIYQFVLSDMLYERRKDLPKLIFMRAIMEEIHHKDDIIFYRLNNLFASHYKNSDFKKYMEYVRLNVDLVKHNYGDKAIGYLKNIVIYSTLLLKYCLSLREKNSPIYRKTLEQANDVIEKTINVLQFYAPKESIDLYKYSILYIRRKYDLF